MVQIMSAFFREQVSFVFHALDKSHVLVQNSDKVGKLASISYKHWHNESFRVGLMLKLK